MAVTKVLYDYRQARAGISNQGWYAIEVYYVTFDSATDQRARSIEAYSADDGTNSVPAYGSAHPNNQYIYVISKTAEVSNGPFNFKVTVNYGRVPREGLQNENPLDMPAVISWGHVDTEEPIDEDAYGNPIVNSANVTPDPPVTETFSDLTLRYTANRSSYSPADASAYKHSVNSDSWTVAGRTWSAGEVKCAEYSAEKVTYGSESYYRVTVGFVFRKDGNFKKRRIDQGMVDVNGDNFKDSDGTPLSEPALLNGSGSKLASGATPIWNEYETLPGLAYATHFNWVST